MGNLPKHIERIAISKPILLALASLYLVMISHGAVYSQQANCPEDVSATADLQTLRACVPKLIKTRNELKEALKLIGGFEKRITMLEVERPKIRVPIGAVMAFDRIGGCPIESGWEEFKSSAGRFIVGANGDEFKLVYEGKVPNYSTGGKSAIVLLEEQIPNHWHLNNHRKLGVGHSHQSNKGLKKSGNNMNWMVGPISRDDTGIVRWSETLNEWKSHPRAVKVPDELWLPNKNTEKINLLPPYIALVYCKKTIE